MSFLRTSLITLLIFQIITPAVWAGEAVIQLAQVKGKVEVVLKGADAAVIGEQGMALHEGDLVQTYKRAKATIVFEKTGTVELKGPARFKIEKATIEDEKTETVTFLEQGKLRAKVRKLAESGSIFQIKTPVAVATVRGTIFSLGVALTGATILAVTKGILEFMSRITKEKALVYSGLLCCSELP